MTPFKIYIEIYKFGHRAVLCLEHLSERFEIAMELFQLRHLKLGDL